jgi:hypothetical protein
MPTCARCLARWGGTRTCHCGACHQTFSGQELFTAHRHQRGEHGGCIPPSSIVDQHGDRRMFERDGIWRGPEMPELARARVKGLDRRAER